MKDELAGLKIVNYDNKGYFAPYSFGNWKIAFLNYADKFSRSEMSYLERHKETDEVFVLLAGAATLLLGENMTEVELQEKKAYVVERDVWHNILLTEDAKILIVENADTGRHNSEIMFLG